MGIHILLFTLPAHAEDNLSPVQVKKFPPNIRQVLKEGESDKNKPVLEDWQVYNKICGAKKPNSTVQGELPIKLIKELSPELAKW